jgi:hypothetical protein
LLALATATGAVAVAVAAVPSSPASGAAGVAHAAALPAGLTALHSHRLIPAPAGAHVASRSFATPSVNWSGYVERGPQPFTSVSAQWVVPAVKATPDDEATGTWVGIDGVDNQTLVQTGTAQQVVGGQPQYYAWWEALPDVAQPLWPVSPGDTIQASITETTANNWSITIKDVTTGQPSTIQVANYPTPGTTAEWIMEAPVDGTSQSLSTLANYGTITFTALRANGAAPTPASLEAYDITDQAGNIISTTGPFDAGADAFTVTYTGAGPATTTTSPPSTTTTVPGGPPPQGCATPADHAVAGHPVAIAAMRTAGGCEGYWVVTAQGQVVPFGAAQGYGDLSAVAHAPIVAIIASPTGLGYWLATADGMVRGYGDAIAVGDMAGHHLNGSIIAMAATPDGKGYWLVGSDGGIFTFGDAAFYGSTGNLRLNKPVVGIAPAPGGRGYWLVASDGGIFTFGTATFLGSMGATRLNQPVVGMTADPGGRGYRMVASDGGIFSFGAPFFGSLGNTPPAAGVETMSPSTDGNGYYMLGNDGAVYAFGDAMYLGRA